MALDHFHLTRPPFSPAPDPAFHFEDAARRELLGALQYALRLGDGVIKVTGEAGSGKTMLCSVLAERLAQASPPVQAVLLGQAAPPLQPVRPGANGAALFPLSPQDAVCSIARQLGLAPGGLRSDEIMRLLHGHLTAERAAGQRAVLLVEESQGLPLDTLETLRQLTNLTEGPYNLLPVVLLGTPELSNVLRQPRLRQLRERITLSFVLPPLPSELAPELLAHRLRMAGHADGALFQLDAAKLIARTAGADLHALIALAGKSLSVAANASAQAVAMFHVRDVIKGVPVQPAPPSAPPSPPPEKPATTPAPAPQEHAAAPADAAPALGIAPPSETSQAAFPAEEAPPDDAAKDAHAAEESSSLPVEATQDAPAVTSTSPSAETPEDAHAGGNALATGESPLPAVDTAQDAPAAASVPPSAEAPEHAHSATESPLPPAEVARDVFAAEETPPAETVGDAYRAEEPPQQTAAATQAALFPEDAPQPTASAAQADLLPAQPPQAELALQTEAVPAPPPEPAHAEQTPAVRNEAAAILHAAFSQAPVPPKPRSLSRSTLAASGAMLAVAGIAIAAFLLRPAAAPASAAAPRPAAPANVTLAATAPQPVRMALPPSDPVPAPAQAPASIPASAPASSSAPPLPAPGPAPRLERVATPAQSLAAAAPAAAAPAEKPALATTPVAKPPAPPRQAGLLKQSLLASKTWLRDEPDNNFCIQIENFPASDSASAEKFLADTRAAIGLSQVHSYPMLIKGERRIAIVYGSFSSAKKVMEVQASLAERSGTHHKIRTIKGIRAAVAAAGKSGA